MVTLLGGIVGGLVATIVMTVFMMALGDDSPPPTAVFWSKYVGDGPPDENVMPGMVLHVVYGAIAGGLFAVVVPLLGFVSVATIASAVIWGLVYGVVLFVGAAVFWGRIVLGMNPDPRAAGTMLVSHLVYGAVLGAWVGYGILG
jgi:hypothetical protein